MNGVEGVELPVWNAKREDYYMRARVGSKAWIEGYEFERLCANCNQVKEIVDWWNIDPEERR